MPQSLICYANIVVCNQTLQTSFHAMNLARSNRLNIKSLTDEIRKCCCWKYLAYISLIFYVTKIKRPPCIKIHSQILTFSYLQLEFLLPPPLLRLRSSSLLPPSHIQVQWKLKVGWEGGVEIFKFLKTM